MDSDCQLSDSPLPEIRHICNVSTTTWTAPVDVIVMRSLLDILPSDTLRLKRCSILPCAENEITLNNSPDVMVNIIHFIDLLIHLCSLRLREISAHAFVWLSFCFGGTSRGTVYIMYVQCTMLAFSKEKSYFCVESSHCCLLLTHSLHAMPDFKLLFILNARPSIHPRRMQHSRNQKYNTPYF